MKDFGMIGIPIKKLDLPAKINKKDLKKFFKKNPQYRLPTFYELKGLDKNKSITNGYHWVLYDLKNGEYKFYGAGFNKHNGIYENIDFAFLEYVIENYGE